VYERYKGDALTVAAAVLGRASAEAAWDVLHDVFVALARTAPGLADDTNLRSYLARAAANRARDVLRRRQRQPAALDEQADHPGDFNAVAQTLENREAHAELWRAVLDLPEEQRGVIALHVWGGMTLREVAQVLDVSENTAQSRYRYALQKLKRHYRVGVAP
jgi:RNA polymerase sigma factor (sigma-70 family)